MELRKVFAKCKVSPGFFDTEFYITLADSSAFVSAYNVKVDHRPAVGVTVDGQVMVYVVTESAKDALVELPGEPVVGGLRTTVSKALLAG